MKSFKLLTTMLVLYFGLAVSTIAADEEAKRFSYAKGGATFSAEYKDGKITKLVRNKKVIYRSTRNTRLGSVKKQIKSLTRNIQALIKLDESQSSGAERKALEDKIINQMNKVTLRLSR